MRFVVSASLVHWKALLVREILLQLAVQQNFFFRFLGSRGPMSTQGMSLRYGRMHIERSFFAFHASSASVTFYCTSRSSISLPGRQTINYIFWRKFEVFNTCTATHSHRAHTHSPSVRSSIQSWSSVKLRTQTR